MNRNGDGTLGLATPGAFRHRPRKIMRRLCGKAPLVAGRRMWAAYFKLRGRTRRSRDRLLRSERYRVRFDRPAWPDVCDGPVPVVKEGFGRTFRHELHARRNIVFCSNTGAVVALNAATGRRGDPLRARANPISRSAWHRPCTTTANLRHRPAIIARARPESG